MEQSFFISHQNQTLFDRSWQVVVEAGRGRTGDDGTSVGTRARDRVPMVVGIIVGAQAATVSVWVQARPDPITAAVQASGSDGA